MLFCLKALDCAPLEKLEPLSGEMAIFSLADEDLPAAEQEEVGKKLWLLGSDPEIWQPGQMEIMMVEVPPIISDQSILEERRLGCSLVDPWVKS